MDELTAEQVWEMVKAHSPTIRELVYIGTAEWGCHSGWHISEEWIAPNHALALIVDAAKREMGEDWYGCERSQKKWKAYVYTKSKDGDTEIAGVEVVIAPTESAAVLAAYLAWKEGR